MIHSSQFRPLISFNGGRMTKHEKRWKKVHFETEQSIHLQSVNGNDDTFYFLFYHVQCIVYSEIFRHDEHRGGKTTSKRLQL